MWLAASQVLQKVPSADGIRLVTQNESFACAAYDLAAAVDSAPLSGHSLGTETKVRLD